MHKNHKLWSSALAISASLTLAVPAFAQGQSGTPQSSGSSSIPSAGGAKMQSSERMIKAMEDKGATPADQALNQRIRQALSGDMTLAIAIQKVHLDTDNGEVTLHGSVMTDKQKADIAAKVQQVAGVKKVDNQLRTAAN
jgi:osmotically-inducible protein OsmY